VGTTTDTFATVEQMLERSQGEISPDTHPYLTRELRTATERIRNLCGWHVAPVKALTYRHGGPSRRSVWLPAMEIQSIDEVTVDGETVALSDVEFDPDTGWTNIRGCSVTVKYTAGFSEVPSPLETLTLELAAVGLGTSLGFSRQQAGAVSVTYDRTGGALTAESEAELAPYRVERLP